MNPSEPIAGFEQIDIAKSLEEGTTRTTSITTTTTSSTSLPPLKTTSSANPSIFTTKIKILILLALTFFSLILATIILFLSSSHSENQKEFPFYLNKTSEEFKDLLSINNLIDRNNYDPSEKSKLPIASHPIMFNETGWSSYRPQLYFGLKNRRPDSPLFGVMWYRQKLATKPEDIVLRNWAKHGSFN
uniref:Glycosyl hydrolase family 63 N-terminal domain-containing protein n=1 Tax=Meloidogyne incognita TaxID=6306 RepID=A0A914NIN0_MELIC